jgi:copper resistance protein C
MLQSMRRALAGACLLVLVAGVPAAAHAEFVSACPGPDDVISQLPSELVATFSQDLSPDRTSIELRDASGQTLARGGKDPAAARLQRLTLPALGPGIYEVRWVSFSAEDAELDRGTYTFTIVAATDSSASTVAACPSPVESPTPAASAGVAPSPGTVGTIDDGALPSMSAPPVAVASPAADRWMSPEPSPAP